MPRFGGRPVLSESKDAFMLNTTRALVIAGLLLTSANLPADAAIPQNVTFRNFFKSGTDSLIFNRPLLVRPYPAEDSAFVVLQQNGKILTVRWLDGSWKKTDSATLVVTGGTSGGNEQGLLGFAFHPNYRANGKYYVYYITASGGIDLLAERVAGTSLRPATSDAQRTLMRVTDPYSNHNGGTIAFGNDGYLYFGIGDGGDGGDPGNRAQNKDELLGKFHRLDVDGPDAFPADTTRNYAIPASNPFKDSTSYKPEIWATGVRNPFKWSFHPVTGELWAGDVGQNNYEEITRVPKGANLGWKIREAAFCYNASSCGSAGLTPPALTISRGHGYSITGGVFFVGNPAGAFHETYLFGDYGTGNVWATRVSGTNLIDSTLVGSVNKVASFDLDRRGRVLATSIGTGSGQTLNSNSGRVLVLESPDMQLSGNVGVRHSVRPGIRMISLSDVCRNPQDYRIQGLDGRRVAGKYPGIVLVRKKGSAEPAQLLSLDGAL
jgi:hypothetical protein